MKPKIAIIGGGLTGLALGHFLKKRDLDFTLFEQSNRVGGAIRTEEKAGFQFETGPSTGLMGSAELAELIEDLQCPINMADEQAKYRWIWKNNKWEVLPNGLLGGITTPLFSFADKVRLLGEAFRKPGNNPKETLADLVRRRMGKSFLNYAVDPFVSGIYAGNPETLITKYALPKLYQLEQKYGSFIGGTIKKSKEKKTMTEKKATRETFSFPHGLSELTDALALELKEHLVLQTQNLHTSPTPKGYHLNYNNTQKAFDIVISTIPGWAIPKVFPFLQKEKMQPISQLSYSPVVQVSVGFNHWQGIELKAFGGLIPSVENRQILGTLFLSSFLKNRTPQGGALLSVFLGGIRRPHFIEKSDEEISTIVESELCSLFQIKHWKPSLLEIRRHPQAIPQYDSSSEARCQAINELEAAHPGIILAGNIKDGISMSDRVKQAAQIAQRLSPKLN